jgi:hypothetical protein
MDVIQEKKAARSVPEKLGRIGRYKTATVRRAFVAAARFVGGQFFALTPQAATPIPCAILQADKTYRART